jgi:hypothetical protein
VPENPAVEESQREPDNLFFRLNPTFPQTVGIRFSGPLEANREPGKFARDPAPNSRHGSDRTKGSSVSATVRGLQEAQELRVAAQDHDLRLGGELNFERSASFFDSNFGGTFLFDTDRPFNAADLSTYPYRYTVSQGDSTLDRDMNLYSLFIQDNWRVLPNLTINLGVRYDVETLAPHLKNTGQEGLFSIAGLPADTNLTGTLEGDCTGPIGSDASRPDPNWLALRHYATEGDKWYKGLQMGVRKRFSNNFQFQFSYTLAKTEDNAEDFVADPQSHFHPEREKAISNEDQRHRLVLSGSWRLPWDIQVGGILTYSNARPFNITMGTDWNGNGNSEQDRPDSVPTTANLDQGSINARPYYPEGPRLRGADGVLPRNSGIGPDFFTIDLRVSKFIRFGNRSVEILGEFFNLTNRLNVEQPSGNVRSSQFYLRRLMRGEIADTATFDPFQAQIGFRFNFQRLR